METLAPLRLTPLVSRTIEQFLSKKELLFELLDGLGSPLNILFPQSIRSNIDQFHSVLARNNIDGRIFFAHKCNQSNSLIRQLSIEEASVDVSSLKELQHALSLGFTGDRIECTGPKTADLIALCIQHGVWINVDCIPELYWVTEIAAQVGSSRATSNARVHLPVRILLRLSGFDAPHSQFVKKSSRFGVPFSQLDQALNLLAEHPEIELCGFSFHLDTTSVLERTIAIENCIEAFDTSIERGFSPNILDIGGGYKINYLCDAHEWNRYTTALKESVLGSETSLTWQGNSFGLHAENGVLKGSFNSYSYFDKQTGGQFLEELLQQKLQNQSNATVASFLRNNMIQLWIEPGRALVDQCGVTISSVINTHPSSSNDLLVNLSMKRQDLAFLDQEIFVDPIVVHRKEPPRQQPVEVFFAGNLCLESDLIYRHKTFLSNCPSKNDAVVFINTAGYFMDFSASEAIMNPVARKVAIKQHNEKLHWCLDEYYSPFEKE